MFGLKSFDIIIEIKKIVQKMKKIQFFDQQTTLCKLACKKEWQDSFLKFAK
jgi:hypothetical protein